MTEARRQHGIVVTSVPKSGTHLLHSLLTALPDLQPGPNLMQGIDPHVPREERVPLYAANLRTAEPSQVSITHFHHSPLCAKTLNQLPHHRLFLLRDPKDFVVSYLDYVLDEKSKHFHRPIFAELRDDAARIERMIMGHPGGAGVRYLPGVREYYGLFWGWLADADTHIVRYEELCEPRNCARVLRRISDFLGLACDEPQIDQAIEVGLRPERSPTYRVGRSGRWRERFTPELTALYERETGDLDARLGYACSGGEAEEGRA
jgi:Sulfotransferase domain